MANLTPLIWTYAGEYAFASTPVATGSPTNARLRTGLTRISWFPSATVAPHAALTPEDEDQAGAGPTQRGPEGAEPGQQGRV